MTEKETEFYKQLTIKFHEAVELLVGANALKKAKGTEVEAEDRKEWNRQLEDYQAELTKLAGEIYQMLTGQAVPSGVSQGALSGTREVLKFYGTHGNWQGNPAIVEEDSGSFARQWLQVMDEFTGNYPAVVLMSGVEVPVDTDSLEPHGLRHLSYDVVRGQCRYASNWDPEVEKIVLAVYKAMSKRV